MAEDKTLVIGLDEVQSHVRLASAYLIVISGKTVGKMFKLAGDECVIGRSGEADVHLEDDGVSRRHARIVRSADGSLALEDLRSTNGTWFNGQRVGTHPLHDGDKFQIGSTTILKFSYQDALEEQFQKQLYESATRDGLTRVYNKRFFLDRLEQEFSYCARHKLPLSLILFDIDHFKKINDGLGHPAGDAVLQTLAGSVSEAIRTEDILCRFGGEEFAIVMRESPEDKAFILAERIRRLVQSTEFAYGGQKIPVTISTGVATLAGGNLPSAQALIAEADRYLYEAKQRGRNRVDARMLHDA